MYIVPFWLAQFTWVCCQCEQTHSSINTVGTPLSCRRFRGHLPFAGFGSLESLGGSWRCAHIWNCRIIVHQHVGKNKNCCWFEHLSWSTSHRKSSVWEASHGLIVHWMKSWIWAVKKMDSFWQDYVLEWSSLHIDSGASLEDARFFMKWTYILTQTEEAGL